MKLGSLFSGYGGLELGIGRVLDVETVWHCEIDSAASNVLAHRWPGVPNLGDITKVDWTRVEPVDVLCGGFPCQDISHAGKRAGIRPDTRSGLWAQFAYAIGQLRPGLVVIENVGGLLSAAAHSDMEPCPWCVGDGPGSGLRALGAVLGDLADLGYDASWCGIRAADVGAPHGRFRVFIAAYPSGVRRGTWRPAAAGETGSGRAPTDVARRDLLPAPTARDYKGHNERRDSSCLTGALLPTPAVNDMGEGKTVDQWDEWTAAMQAKHGNGNGHGKSLAIEAQRLLPTPTSMDSRASGGNPDTTGTHGTTLTDATVRQPKRWGVYADAITRWETLLGRPAPPPTQPSRKGTPQLSPRFTEWMMGLPDGWVCDVPGLSRNQQLKALGNGVVPQQAAAAVALLTGVRPGAGQ